MSRLRIAAPALLLGALMLTACSVGQEVATPDGAVPEPAVEGRDLAEGGLDPSAASTVPVDAGDRSIIQNASVTVEVQDVGATATSVRAIVAGLDGVVAQEDTTLSDSASPRSWLVVRVPSASLDAALEQFAALGTVVQQGASSDDVTGQVVDLEARIRSQEASVERVRALLAEAESLGDVVTIEAELTRRQADLEALQAQAALLADQVALASVTITLTEPGTSTGGFADGLRAGWDAFVESARTVATGLGAALPFVVAVAVLLLPIVVVVRARRREDRRAEPEPQEPISVG